MINDLKPLTQYHPLPAIGQTKPDKNTVIVYDINRSEHTKLQDILKPITPASIQGYRRQKTMDFTHQDDKPYNLLRENTYDVIRPIILRSPKVKKRDPTTKRALLKSMDERTELSDKEIKEEPKLSPKSRFKNAAYKVANLSTTPQTGKLLCLRQRETFGYPEQKCRLEKLPESPVHQLDKLSEIFECLEMKGRVRDRMKKDNTWF